MADANTTLYGLVKPEVGASADSWGGKLNQDYDDIDALLGAITTTGSSNAYVLTTGLSLAAYVSGQSFLIKANFTNSGAATINVDTLGAKSLVKGASTALASGDITSGAIYRIAYDGTNFIVLNAGAGSYQPLDATLTALAALSWSSGSSLLQFTAADTVSLTLTPSVTSLTVSSQVVVPAGSTGTPGLLVGTGAGLYSLGSNNLTVVTGGAQRINIASTGFTSQVLYLAPNGTVGAPSYSFGNDADNGLYYIGTNNWGLAAGGSKIVDIATTGIAVTGSVRGRIPLSSETSGTLTVVSANAKINASGGITLPASVFTADDAIIIDGNGTARTITRGSGLTMYVNGTDSATATLAANGVMGVTYRSATVCILTGNVS